VEGLLLYAFVFLLKEKTKARIKIIVGINPQGFTERV